MQRRSTSGLLGSHGASLARGFRVGGCLLLWFFCSLGYLQATTVEFRVMAKGDSKSQKALSGENPALNEFQGWTPRE